MAEISVTGGVFATLTPIFTLWYGHKDITYDITPYVTSISYHDSIKNESDTIAITLDDTDGRWIKEWYPGKGDTLALHMGYQGEKLLDCGQYIIDKIDISAPPSTVNIDGIATSVNQALRTRNSQGFEETTLSAIASRIAQTHGLKLVGKIEPLTIDRVTQYGETDVGFLKRLASEYGYAVKVTTKELIFSHLPTLRCLAPVKRSTAKTFRISPSKIPLTVSTKTPPYSIKIVRKKNWLSTLTTASKNRLPVESAPVPTR